MHVKLCMATFHALDYFPSVKRPIDKKSMRILFSHRFLIDAVVF